MTLPDLVAPGLDLIFCGTAPGRTSAARGHYYARPGNLFWPMLAESGLTSRRLRPEEDALLPSLGLGLTDLAAKGTAGQDAEIPASAWQPARLAALVAELAPRGLAFTSLRAAREALGGRRAAGRQPVEPRFGGTVLWVLPSPSGLARRHFAAAPWHELGQWVMALRRQRGER